MNGGSDLYIDGGEGNDRITVDWNKTKGNVTLVADKGTTYADTVTVKNLKVANTNIAVENGKLIVTEDGTGRQLIIENWEASSIKGVAFADGTKTRDYLNTSASLASGKAEGTANNDNITINEKILGIGSNKYQVPMDNISAENPFVVDAGAGNDNFNVTNAQNYKLVLGEGNDKVTVDWKNSHDITIVAGTKAGETESITVKNAKFIDFTPSIDGAGNLVLSSKDGNLTIENFGSGTVKEITFADGKVSQAFIEGISNGEFIGTEAADKVTLNGTASMFGKVGFDATDLKSIDTKAGNDTVIINSAEDIDVSTGEGNDIVTINDAEGIDVSTGEGNDIVTINDAADVDVFTGVGVDTINVNSGRDLYIDGGNDNDKITVDWAKTSGNITLVADKGTTYADVITIKNLKFDDPNIKVSGEDGNLVIMDGDRQLVIENWEASGIKSIAFADGKKTEEDINAKIEVVPPVVDSIVEINNEEWSASNGNDKVTVNGSGNTLNLLDGDDTLIVNGSSNIVNSGSGHNNITIDSYGGTEVINGGTATNDITISGAENVQFEAGEILTEQDLEDYRDGKLTGAEAEKAEKVERYWNGTLQGDNVTIKDASGYIEIAGSIGNDKYILSGTGSNSSIFIGDSDDGNDYIEISNVGSANISGGNGNDKYVIDWQSVGNISIRNSNDPWPEPDPWADVETSIKQENDKLVLKNVKSNEVTISWVEGVEFNDHGQFVNKVVRVADINNSSHYVDIAYWNENNMTEIVFDDRTLNAADINALLDAGGGSAPEENIINIPNSSYDTVIVEGTDRADRFVFGLQSNQYGTIIENYGKEDVIDCSNLLQGLSSNYGIMVSVNRNHYEEHYDTKDLLLWFDVRNKETGEPINRNGDVILKDFFANGSVGTVNVNGKLLTVVGDNADNSWSASYNSEIHFLGYNINTTIEKYNKDTIIDISQAIDYDKGKTWYERSGNNLVLRIQDENNDTSSSITFVDYYVNIVKPRLRLYGDYSTVLTVGTDGVDNVNLNNLFDAKEDGGIVYFAGSGNDVITAGNGNHYIFAGAGNDTVTVNNDGNDVCVEGTSGQNTVTITGAGDVDVVAGAGTGDTITVSDSEYAYILGEAGNDKININDVSRVTVEADDGDDVITVSGLKDADLTGGLGNDTYDIGWNSASNIWLNQYNDPEPGFAVQEQDKLVLRGVDFSDLEFRRYNDEDSSYPIDRMEIVNRDVYSDLKNGLTVDGFSKNLFESIEFADGKLNVKAITGTAEQSIDYSSLQQGVFVVNESDAKVDIKGTVHNDYVEVINSNDVVHGNAGNDYITDYPRYFDQEISDVKLYGDAGNDRIYVANGDNYSIEGGSGDDIITVYSGSQHMIDGGSGNDVYEIKSWVSSDACYVICQGSAAVADKDTLIVENYRLDGVSFTVHSTYETSYGVKNNVLCLEYAGSKILVTDWSSKPLAKLNIGGVVLSTDDVNAILEGTYANKTCTVEFTKSYQNVYVPSSWQYDTIKVLGADANATNSMFKLEEGKLQIQVRADSSSADYNNTLGIIYVNNVQSTGLQQIVMGEGTTASVINVIGDGAIASYTGTSSIDGYLFVGTGWQVTVSDLQRPDCLDFSAYRDASSVRYNTVQSGKDLQLTAFYYDNNDEVHTYGTVTLKNYFADSNGDGVADGNDAGIRVKTAYRYNSYYSGDSFVTSWDRLYVDTSNKDLNFDVKEYMGTVNERQTAVGNNSARGIFFSSGTGNDVIVAGEGRDYISTGAGDDTVYVNNHYYGTEEYVPDNYSEPTRDQIFTGDGNDKVYIGTYDENFDTSAKCNGNFVRTGEGDDYIQVRGDDNNVGSGSGDDIIKIHGGRNRVSAGDGNDKVLLWSSGRWTSGWCVTGEENVGGQNRAYGGAGDDIIYVRQGGNSQLVSGDAGNDTYVVQYNRATGLTIDQSSAIQEDKDKLVIMGVDTSKLEDISIGLEDGQLHITGTADRWWNSFGSGEYTLQKGLNVNITIQGWLGSELESIELVDIDNNRTLTYSGNAITEAVQNAMTSFKDIAVDPSTNTIGATEQEQLNTLKLYSNTCDPSKTSL